MKTYQEWRDLAWPLMSWLYPEPTGIDLHESYKRYCEGRREEQAEREAILQEIL